MKSRTLHPIEGAYEEKHGWAHAGMALLATDSQFAVVPATQVVGAFVVVEVDSLVEVGFSEVEVEVVVGTVVTPVQGVVGFAVTQLHKDETLARTLTPVGIPHAEVTQPKALFWIAAELLHWHWKSEVLQPTASPAERMQLLAQSGTA